MSKTKVELSVTVAILIVPLVPVPSTMVPTIRLASAVTIVRLVPDWVATSAVVEAAQTPW